MDWYILSSCCIINKPLTGQFKGVRCMIIVGSHSPFSLPPYCLSFLSNESNETKNPPAFPSKLLEESFLTFFFTKALLIGQNSSLLTVNGQKESGTLQAMCFSSSSLCLLVPTGNVFIKIQDNVTVKGQSTQLHNTRAVPFILIGH